MRNLHLKTLAGGGLLSRRDCLTAGVGFLSALSVTSQASAQETPLSLGERLPNWMSTPGSGNAPYGFPSEYEGRISRLPSETTDETGLFSIFHTPLQNQRGAITPNGLHFSVCHNGIPDIPPEEHQLILHGLVEKPLMFDLESLERYPMVSVIRFLECAGNTAQNAVSLTAMDLSVQKLFGQVSGAEWTGIPLRSLLNEAIPKPKAKWVIAEGADSGSHARSIPLDKLMDDAILALYQNGERLRPDQGYPMRLFLPGWEGNTNIKWLHRLEVTDRPAYTKDESGLYADILKSGKIQHFSFPMDVKSVITHPSGQMQLPERKGYYEICGLAWSGYGRITKVEVSADGGKSWAVAELNGVVAPKALTSFSIPWRWDGRSAMLLSRATDEFGNTQPTRADWKERYASHSFNHFNAIQTWYVSSSGMVENVYA